MDPAELKLTIEVVKLIAGLVVTLQDLVFQVQSGEEITPEQRDKARALRKEALAVFIKTVEEG